MNAYHPPLDDIRFNFEVFGFDRMLGGIERFKDFDLATSMTLLGEYASYCADVLHPLNAKGDAVGVKYNAADRSVTTPPGFREAYTGFRENGFLTLAWNPEYGGMGAPMAVHTLAGEILIGANKSFSMCSGLTTGLIEALEEYGTPEQKATYLPKLISGTWTGTMCLTEPQCGTDLGLITTTAVPSGDGFVLTGTKVWITFGEHDLADNIVHLVLARLPDAPRGIKGISAFIVPKFLEDGTRNPVFCGGTDHKMGIHASPTCVMNLEGAKGWLVGERDRGMRAMFVMMNAARLNVGIEGVALGEAAYQAALSFAKDRRQSRSLAADKQDRKASADNILVHPDVRRMLMEVKSTTEGLRSLVCWVAMNADVSHHDADPAKREKAEDLVALLTPIIKSFGSERGFHNVSTAMQVMGGAGYTRDWPVEQYLRDVRIAMIYEGTNHIQALDLVGRKLPMHGGRLLMRFADEISALIRECADDPRMAEFLGPLKAESKRLTATTMDLGAKAAADPELLGAAASNYLNQFALVTLAFVWARQVQAVLARDEADPLRRSKLQTARYYFQMVLPEAAMYAAKVAVGKQVVTDLDVDLL